MEKKAPPGQYRVIGLDYLGDKGWKKGDYHTFAEATEEASRGCSSNIRFIIYNDTGKCVYGKNGKISQNSP